MLAPSLKLTLRLQRLMQMQMKNQRSVVVDLG
jgi:hypothetical protein